MNIIIIGRVAEDGILELFENNREKIVSRYSKRYISEGLAGLEAEFGDDKCMRILNAAGPDVFVVGRQGIFSALYKLGGTCNTGLRVQLREIPIRQFCIEIADMCDVNPYRISSLGCVLACCADGARLAGELDGAGFKSTVIGYTTDDKARCAITGARLQYITPED